jgi:hypothetical protein
MRARRRGLSKVIRRRIFWRFRRHAAYCDVPLIGGGKQCRHLDESFFGQSILELHRASQGAGAAMESAGGWTGGRSGAARERVWLLETGSSTHNEFRLAARPLSGDSGRLVAPTNQYSRRFEICNWCWPERFQTGPATIRH